jgi:DNA-binding NarL/FixJ family response regulator
VRVVAVVHAGDATVADALAAGFDGLLFASDADAALAATVRGVCAGQFVAPRAAFRSGRRPVLSGPEQQLLRMVADGLTNAQIAAQLGRGESTVKARLSALFAKLGVRSRGVAAAAMLEGRLNGSPVEVGKDTSSTRRKRSDGSAAALVGDDATLDAMWGAAEAAALDVIDAAVSAPALVRALGARQVDVVVACTDEPTRVECVRALRDALPSATLIVIVPPAAGRGLRALAEAGADACVLQSELAAVLEVAVLGARAGRVSVPHAVRGRLECPALSYREREVVAWAVCGAANRQIAAKLFVSESTVKSHLVSAFAKLDVHSRAEAAELVLDPHNGIEIGVADIVGERPQEVNRAA